MGDAGNGIISKMGVGHADFQWFVRTRPMVRSAFETIWGGDGELLCSFDGCNVFRPWHSDVTGLGPSVKTRGGWWHVDQGKSKLGRRHAVQGLVTLKVGSGQPRER